MIAKPIKFFGNDLILVCDANCKKAWGKHSRPFDKSNENEDDKEWLSDSELDIAPDNPKTYEGGYGKPVREDERLNRWCARECERSIMAKHNEFFELEDWSKRIKK
jgi:ribosomal protein S27AE